MDAAGTRILARALVGNHVDVLLSRCPSGLYALPLTPCGLNAIRHALVSVDIDK